VKRSDLSKGEVQLAYLSIQSYGKLYDASDCCDEMMLQ